MKKKKLIIILLLIIIVAIFFIMGKNGFIGNVTRIIRGEEDRQEEIGELFSYVVYDNRDEKNIKVLITVNSESGIEYIQCPNGNILNGNGTQKLGFDYEVYKEQEYKFIIKEINKDELQEKQLKVDDKTVEDTAIELDIIDIEGYTTFNCEKKIRLDGYNKYYYKIGKSNSWVEGTQDYMFDYDVIQKGLANDGDTITISAKIINDINGDEVIISKEVNIVEVQEDEIESESLIKAIGEETIKTGKYNITVSDTTYNTKVYNIVGDTNIIMNTIIGMPEDVGTANSNAQNMIILKVNGNLTIEQGTSIVPYGNSYGGPKGMFIYCTGTLTNNGTISMTARGAKAEGQNVYLWKNNDEEGSYECIPAVGGNGAVGAKNVKSTYSGLGQKGANGINRQSGGGGAGAMFRWQQNGNNNVCNVGNGGNGTSYSGGSGSGGLNVNHSGSGTYTTGSGSSSGGSGGSAIAVNYGANALNRGAGGGAGNPGGIGQYNKSNNQSLSGSNGTGGLLVLYSKDIVNTGTISSNGAKGGNASAGNAEYAGGGSSGGGSINIFYTNEINGTEGIQANGGISNYGGGAGGTGCITAGSIATGNFVCEYKNY